MSNALIVRCMIILNVLRKKTLKRINNHFIMKGIRKFEIDSMELASALSACCPGERGSLFGVERPVSSVLGGSRGADASLRVGPALWTPPRPGKSRRRRRASLAFAPSLFRAAGPSEARRPQRAAELRQSPPPLRNTWNPVRFGSKVGTKRHASTGCDPPLSSAQEGRSMGREVTF